ncbi:MAG: NAD(P)-dependent alcohol dehydrogenase [Deltaproteobacteria bacterium]|nr:NAD(P)-dependent alcohol dehydrogenase [Deltaproteobacteria bacterium]
MKAFEIRDKFGIEALALVERPAPEPGPKQVLVRMRALSLNYRDLMIVKGLYPNLRTPLVPLSDGVGEVVEPGEGATRFKRGQRVAGIFQQRWISGNLTKDNARSALGGDLEGVLSEYALFDEEGLVSVPEHLTDIEAATLPCAAVTAWNALVCAAQVKPGDSILVQGTGGVSIFALQFGRLLGASVIVTSSSDEKLERARGLGASGLINYKKVPQWDEKVLELTGGIGVDHVVETGGAGTLNKSMRCARIGGHISLIGILSGASAEMLVPLALVKQLRLQGIYVGSREMFEAMNRAISLHQLRPVVDRVFAFEEAREALRYMESGAHFGKIAIRL